MLNPFRRWRENRDKLEHADLSAGAVDAMRTWASEGLGFNCTFVDDDMRVVVGLAQRAVLAGLASDFSDDMQKRFMAQSEAHRRAHERSLGYAIKAHSASDESSRSTNSGTNKTTLTPPGA